MHTRLEEMNGLQRQQRRDNNSTDVEVDHTHNDSLNVVTLHDGTFLRCNQQADHDAGPLPLIIEGFDEYAKRNVTMWKTVLIEDRLDSYTGPVTVSGKHWPYADDRVIV